MCRFPLGHHNFKDISSLGHEFPRTWVPWDIGSQGINVLDSFCTHLVFKSAYVCSVHPFICMSQWVYLLGRSWMRSFSTCHGKSWSLELPLICYPLMWSNLITIHILLETIGNFTAFLLTKTFQKLFMLNFVC